MMSGSTDSFTSRGEMGVGEKLGHLSWGLILLISAIAAVGVVMLFSAGGGQWEPWAVRQATRFALGLGVMFAVALVDLRVWLRLAYPIYAATLVLLVAVELMGHIGMGAQRWINLGGFVLQPSELMKIALTLALARYFHALPPEQTSNPLLLLPPIALILVPAGLVVMQPNLGTALLLVLASAMMFWGAGVPGWIFGSCFAVGFSVIPIGWQFLQIGRASCRERV